ncbi:MAG: diguanylate cyclase domain-containing protein [Leptospirales bacterium]
MTQHNSGYRRFLGYLHSLSLEVKILLGMVIPSILFLFLLFAFTYAAAELFRSQIRMDDLEHEQFLVNRTISDLKDAESGQRGFLITGIPSYLEPYRIARKNLLSDLQELSLHTDLVPGFSEDMPQLNELVDEKLGELRGPIALRKNGSIAAAKKKVMSNISKKTMESIRQLSLRMVSQCQAAIRLDRKMVVKREHRLIWVGLLTAFLIVVMLSLLYKMIHRDIEERKFLMDRLEYGSTHDCLTHLYNRAFFTENLQTAIYSAVRDQHGLAIFLIDLDGFKQVNDRLGHQVGDAVLVEVARRFGHISRESDILARLGGDEFVLMFHSPEGEQDLPSMVLMAERLLSIFSMPILPELEEIPLGASIGIAVFPSGGTNPDALLKSADQALYLAKKTGRNRYRFHADSTLKLS